MKKAVVLMLLLVMGLGTSVAWAAEVLFVVNDTNMAAAAEAGDALVKARLEGMPGITVTLKQAAASATADATGKALVLISESCGSGDVLAKFKDVTVPVMTCEPAVCDDMLMTGLTNGTDYGAYSGNAINIVNNSHPMAAGKPLGSLTVYTDSTTAQLNFFVPSANAIKIAEVVGTPAQVSIFAYELGSTMVGLAAPERRTGFFFRAPGPTVFTPDAWDLFDAAVRWTSYFIVPVELSAFDAE